MLSLCTISCTQYKSNLDAVKIRYYPNGIETPWAIDEPEGLFGNGLGKDTIIQNKRFLSKLDCYLQKLTPLNDQDGYVDIRMYCLIKFKDGSKQELCLGEKWGIQYNGVLMDDFPELTQFIKSITMDHYIWEPE